MRKLIAVLALFLFASVLATAQTGFPPFGSFENGRFDSTNRQNLNTNFAIPLASAPGRGLGISLSLVNDSLIFKNTLSGGIQSWTPVVDGNNTPTWGWKLTSPFGNVKRRYFQTTCREGGINYPVYHWDNWVYLDGLGTAHNFNAAITDSSACTGGGISGTFTGYATDLSGYYIDLTNDLQNENHDNPTLYSPSGMKMNGIGDITQITDTNGNYITRAVSTNVSTWTDTLNRTALKITDNRTSNPPNTLYQYLAEGGTPLNVQVNYTAYNIKTNFQCTSVTEYASSGTVLLPTQVVFLQGDPHQLTYSIAYEDTLDSVASRRDESRR
jgi:hypothetical protein